MFHVQLVLQIENPPNPKTHKHLSWVQLKEMTKRPLFDLGFKEQARQKQRETIVLVCSLAAARLPSPSSNGPPVISMTWWHSDSGASSDRRPVSVSNTPCWKARGNEWDFTLIVIVFLEPCFPTSGVSWPTFASLFLSRNQNLFHRN